MEEWDGEDRREKQRWRIKKEVAVGDLVAFALATLAVITAYTTLDKRIALLELETGQMNLYNRNQDSDRASIRSDIKEQLREINQKVDRLTQSLLDGRRNGGFNRDSSLLRPRTPVPLRLWDAAEPRIYGAGGDSKDPLRKAAPRDKRSPLSGLQRPGIAYWSLWSSYDWASN